MPSRLTLLLVALVLPMLTSCAGDHEAEPTIPSVNFEPRLVVLVGADGLTVEASERSEGAPIDPPSVPEGSVIEVRNTDSEDHRITAGTTIDTGFMQPGDSTTVVMRTEGEIELRDRDGGATLAITVTPRTGER